MCKTESHLASCARQMSIILIYKRGRVSVCVCMFLMHGQTTEPIFMKVRTGVHLHQGDVLVVCGLYVDGLHVAVSAS